MFLCRHEVHWQVVVSLSGSVMTVAACTSMWYATSEKGRCHGSLLDARSSPRRQHSHPPPSTTTMTMPSFRFKLPERQASTPFLPGAWPDSETAVPHGQPNSAALEITARHRCEGTACYADDTPLVCKSPVVDQGYLSQEHRNTSKWEYISPVLSEGFSDSSAGMPSPMNVVCVWSAYACHALI